MQYQLGRKPSPFDSRDYELVNYIPRLRIAPKKIKQWDFPGQPLDQGNTPHCVGFGSADWGINLPVQDSYTNADGDKIYYACKVIDGEPNQEDGSCVRSAAKVLQNMGRLNAYAFAATTKEITYWLQHNGPVLVGTEWTNDMFTPDVNNVIHATGASAGGHCYLLNGVPDCKHYHLQNSWSETWGINGGALISIKDFAKLLRSGGEAMAAVELPL
jgi:hypothetical protein